MAQAAVTVRDGDTVEVDSGDYPADVAVWSAAHITLRAVGGRARMVANGASAEGKAIWVVRSRQMTVENFEFVGAAVPSRNGAGIRLERGQLVVRNCLFLGNENGILTGNDDQTELEIESSEFGRNGFGDGYSHNLYAGTIRRLSVTGSYFHHAKVGHLLKSRAAENHIRYNRLTDESGGRASYELEFPSGGVAYVVGNIIEQSAGTENPVIVSFGAEGYRWPRNELYLINNTLVDNRAADGVFLYVRPGADRIVAVNNLLLGLGRLESAGGGEYRNNPNAVNGDFVDAANHDFRLLPGTRLNAPAEAPGFANGMDLAPRREYAHPRRTRELPVGPRLPGALRLYRSKPDGKDARSMVN